MCIAETNSLYFMKRIALLLTAIALTCASANAQSFLEKLGNRAKNAVERNLGNKVEKAVNDALDGKKGSKKDNDNSSAPQTISQIPPKTTPQEYEPVDPYTVTGRPIHSIPIGLPRPACLRTASLIVRMSLTRLQKTWTVRGKRSSTMPATAVNT